MTMPAPGAARPALGIRTRMLLLVGTGVLSSLLILGWSVVASIDGLMAPMLAGRRALARTTAAQAEQAVGELVEALSMASLNPRFDPRDADPAPERQALHLARLRARVLESVLLVDRDGRVLAEDPMRPGTDAAPLGRRAEARTALETGRPVMSALIPMGGYAAHALFVPVRSGAGQADLLVVGVRRIDNQGWARLLRVGPPGETLTIDLVDDRSTIVASSRAARAGETAEGSDLLEALRQRHDVVVDRGSRPGADEEVLAYAPLSLVPWAVVIRQRAQEVFAPVHQARRRLLVWGPLMLALGLLFTWGAAQSVRQPLAVLTRAAERIAAGTLHQKVPPLPADEIGRLGQAFEVMRVKLAASIDDISRTNQQLEARVAERTREVEAAHRELQARDRARGRLLAKVISAQEEERKRLARELHDETCQKLAAIAIGVETALGSASPDVMRERLLEARARATETLDEVHRIIFDLRPSVLDDLGLLAAIRWYATRQLEPRGIAVRFDFPDGALPLAPETEAALFRAAQEAIGNIARHSRAESALVELDLLPDRLRIDIEDDGVGFDVDEVSTPSHSGRGLGLLGLRERMELIGGSALIDSSPGDGTRLRLEVPLGRRELPG